MTADPNILTSYQPPTSPNPRKTPARPTAVQPQWVKVSGSEVGRRWENARERRVVIFRGKRRMKKVARDERFAEGPHAQTNFEIPQHGTGMVNVLDPVPVTSHH